MNSAGGSCRSLVEVPADGLEQPEDASSAGDQEAVEGAGSPFSHVTLTRS
jgi:hypothetical protein